MRRRNFLIGVGAGVGAGVGGHVTTATSRATHDRSARAAVDLGPLEGPVGALQSAGIDGEGVTVGLLDPAGFAPEHPLIAGRVTDHRTVGAVDGPRSHGTAAAVTVAAVAPACSLVLVGYGDARAYRRGIDRLADRTDVVIVPASFYAQPDDGSGPVARATAAALDRTLVVAAAGNLARKHWRTTFTGAGVPGEDPPRVRVTAPDRVRCWLTVREGPSAPSEYALRLRSRDRDRTVAEATPYRADAVTNLRLAERVFPGTYRLHPEGPPGATVDVTAVSHRLLGSDEAGSIAAPATAPGVLAVGAVTDGAAAPFSSRGDGATEVDVVAPASVQAPPVGRFDGTSAAAAATAGVVTLARGTTDSPDMRLRKALCRTARDVGAAGRDVATGHGVVAPERFLERLGSSAEGGEDA